MAPVRISFSVLLSVAVGVTVATLVAWKYVKKFLFTRPLYTAKRIYIVNSTEEWEQFYKQLKKDLTIIKILGLDCEWVQNKKVALLQLASPSGLCGLIRLFKFQSPLPESLHELLADNSILKVGVAVSEDGRRLHQDYGLIVHGCVDLRHVLKRVGKSFQCRSRGLRGLTNGILGMDISKDIDVRCGNWEAETYSQKQVDYAATDAAVAVDIFLTMVFTKIDALANSIQVFKKRKLVSVKSDLSNTPSSLSAIKHSQLLSNNQAVLAAEAGETSEKLILSDVAMFEIGDNNCDTVVKEGSQNDGAKAPADSSDLSKKTESCKMSPVSVNRKFEWHCPRYSVQGNSNCLPSQMLDLLQDCEKKEIFKLARSVCQGIVDCGWVYQPKEGSLRPPSRQSEKNKNNSYSFRKRPLWDNCRLQAPDGSLLCTCDQKKAQWYLDKQLGDTVCEDPLTVRLRFEPSNRPESERNYYLQDKENVCVVCGHDKDYVRKFVVPFEYRKFFPKALKDHSSHDVLLLCTPCHRKSCDSDMVLRLQLAEECNAPLDSGPTSYIVLDFELQKIRSAGRALLSSKNSIPEERILELEKLLKDFYGVEKVTEEILVQASAMDVKQTAENYIPHGQKVVKYMASNGGLLAFQTRWRQHFLDTMNPQHLPAFWSVDFVPEAWNQGHFV